MPSPGSAPPRKSLLAGKYELVELAGKGGMATVWRGRTHGEAGFTRQVAIKQVLPELSSDPDFAAMFVEEARVIAELAHPNIVQVHDFGREADGTYFIVMEWVEGITLIEYVRSFTRVEELPPWHFVTAMVVEVLKALRAAHDHADHLGYHAPIIHRDVTPANIMLANNGVVKLTDFGLARAMDRPVMTMPGVVKGKVAYMAPEILEGVAVSPRTDIYSVGVVIWEALAGQRMFGTGTDSELAKRVLDHQVPPLTEIRTDLPRPLVACVQRMIATDPERRYGRAEPAIRALTAILRGVEDPTDAPYLALSIRGAVIRSVPPV